MKNMNGRSVLTKLKLDWRPPLSLHPNTPIQYLQSHKELDNVNSLGFIEDVKDEKLPSFPNTNSQEKFAAFITPNEERVIASESMENHINNEAEANIPPGGKAIVVLYTTSLRGIRKTFDNCKKIRFLLQSFQVHFHERDVSMDLEYREELWRVLGGRVVPPKLFIRGRHIGGADEVVGLHENGTLKNLLEGIPLRLSNDPCDGCGGVHFVVCGSCNGSRKLVMPVGGICGSSSVKCCSECNENGLVKCSVCN